MAESFRPRSRMPLGAGTVSQGAGAVTALVVASRQPRSVEDIHRLDALDLMRAIEPDVQAAPAVPNTVPRSVIR